MNKVRTMGHINFRATATKASAFRSLLLVGLSAVTLACDSDDKGTTQDENSSGATGGSMAIMDASQMDMDNTGGSMLTGGNGSGGMDNTSGSGGMMSDSGMDMMDAETQTPACDPAPKAWTCGDCRYEDGFCDCECGAWDPDCDVDSHSDTCFRSLCADPGNCEAVCMASAPSLPAFGDNTKPDLSVDPSSSEVLFHNDSDLALVELHLKLSVNSTWGGNGLPSAVLPGKFISAPGLPCQTNMDIQAVFLNTNQISTTSIYTYSNSFPCGVRHIHLLSH